MKQYNTRVSVQLDFNFLNSADNEKKEHEIIANIINMLNSVGVEGLTSLQGFQQNSINFKVEDIKKIASPEDEIENDLAEFDIF